MRTNRRRKFITKPPGSETIQKRDEEKKREFKRTGDRRERRRCEEREMVRRRGDEPRERLTINTEEGETDESETERQTGRWTYRRV